MSDPVCKPLVACSNGQTEHQNLLFRQLHDHLLMMQKHLVILESDVSGQSPLELNMDEMNGEGLYAVNMEEMNGETQNPSRRAPLSSLLCSHTCGATAAGPSEPQGPKPVRSLSKPLAKAVPVAEGDADVAREVEPAVANGTCCDADAGPAAAYPSEGKIESNVAESNGADNSDAEERVVQTEVPDDVDADAESDDDEHDQRKAKIDGAFGSILQHEVDFENPEYKVENFYKEKGCCQAIARSYRFQNFTLFVILLNAIYLGLESEGNHSRLLYDSNPGFVIGAHAFCAFFVFEWAIRFLSFAHKADCLRDNWFKFDTLLMLDMASEVWVLAALEAFLGSSVISLPTEPFRLLRLFRLTRMTRLMKSIPELLTLVKGLVRAMKAVSASIFMVLLLVYIFAILLHMLLKDNAVNETMFEEEGRHFVSLLDCCWTLLLDGAFMQEAAQVMTTLLRQGGTEATIACFLFLFFTVVSALMVMNMLIGILCEVVTAVATAERDDAAVSFVKHSLLKLLHQFDDGDGLLDRAEVDEVLGSKNARRVFRELNVDELFVTELLTTLFRNEESRVSIPAVMRLLLMCRGELTCTVQHMAAGQAFLASKIDGLGDRLASIGRRSEISLRRSVTNASLH